MSKNNVFNLTNLGWLLVFLGISILGFYIFDWTRIPFDEENETSIFERLAQVGDFVGGLVGAIWTLAGVIFFYSALTTQRDEFKEYKNEIRLQKREFEVNRVTNTIYKQSD